MRPHEQIVHGGGWVGRQIVGKPKALFFTFLSVTWLGVSICASIPFWNGFPQPFSIFEGFCMLLIILEPAFISVAVAFWIWEQPRIITRRCRNPDYDIRKSGA